MISLPQLILEEGMAALMQRLEAVEKKVLEIQQVVIWYKARLEVFGRPSAQVAGDAQVNTEGFAFFAWYRGKAGDSGSPFYAWFCLLSWEEGHR